MSIDVPNKYFLKSREQLALFREKFKILLNEIKLVHGENAIINVFPAVPVSIAVEIGRVRMPKADLPFKLYDEIGKDKGFYYTFTID